MGHFSCLSTAFIFPTFCYGTIIVLAHAHSVKPVKQTRGIVAGVQRSRHFRGTGKKLRVKCPNHVQRDMLWGGMSAELTVTSPCLIIVYRPEDHGVHKSPRFFGKKPVTFLWHVPTDSTLGITIGAAGCETYSGQTVTAGAD